MEVKKNYYDISFGMLALVSTCFFVTQLVVDFLYWQDWLFYPIYCQCHFMEFLYASLRIHYIVLSRPSQKCEGLFAFKDIIYIGFRNFLGILRSK